MAERSLSVCDLDNEPTISVAQVHVTVDGQERTFDLCDKHLEAFRSAVAPFVPGGATGRGRGRGAAKSTRRAAKKSTAKTTAAKATGRAAKKSTATVAKAPAGRPAKATRRSAAGGASNTAAVRAWAREQGIAVPERGRLGRDLLDRYQAATAGSATA